MIAYGIPTINQKKLLTEGCIPSIMKHNANPWLCIVDNGDQEITLPPGAVGEVHVPGKNLGVAASWNLMARRAFEYGFEFIVLVNDDIEVAWGENEITPFFEKNRPWLATSNLGWCQFMISREAFERVGEFDEGFWPATYEEHDWAYRLVLELPGRQTAEGPAAIMAPRALKGWEPEFLIDDCMLPSVLRSSESAKADPKLEQLKRKCRYHYEAKWGGLPDQELFKVPFDGNPPHIQGGR